MRKTSIVVCKAFINRKHKRFSNTDTDGTVLRLFGKVIAQWEDENTLLVSMAGWGTATTRERLNTLCRLLKLNIYFSQRNHVQYINGTPMGEDQFVKIEVN